MSGTAAGKKMTHGGVGPYATRVAAISAILIVAASLLLAVSASRQSYEIRAVFDDVRGLIPGGDVTAGSIVVGSVQTVEINDDEVPEVTMEIDDDFELHQGATANIRLASNVGLVNRVVDLEQGDPTRSELPSGTLLGGEATDNPVDFDRAVSTLTPKTRGQIKNILVGLDEALAERGPDIDRTLRHSSAMLNQTANLLAEVNRDGEALRTLVGEGQRVVSALAESPQDLGAAAERTAALLRTTAGRQTELGESIRLLGPALAGGRTLLERTEAAIPTLRELTGRSGPLLEKLGPFADRVPAATRAAGPFVREIRRLVRDAPAQLRAHRPLLRVAPPVVERLSPLLDRLNPVADHLRVFTPETIGFFQNVADAAAPYDANGHMIRIATVAANTMPRSTAAGGEIGPSECTPGSVVAPYHRTPGVNECRPWEDWRESLGSYPEGDGG